MRIVRAGTCALATIVAVSACRCDEELTPIPATGDLRGVLCGDENGQPAFGLTVTLIDASGVEHTASTNASGDFVINDVPVGDAALTINDPSGPRDGEVVIVEDALVEFTDGACRAPPPPPPPVVGSVEGCICDEAVGQWVSGANIFITLAGGAVAVTGTDEAGCFVLDGVPPGTHTLQVQHGVFVEEHPVSVTADATTSLPEVTSCEPPPPPAESGSVQGRVCAPDGETWLSQAEVYVVLADGTRVQTVTDGDGAYDLTGVPVGTQTLTIVKGSFQTTRTVEIVADQVTTIPEDECALGAEDLRIAVVTGDYDRVQDVLASIGVDAEHTTIFDSNYLTGNVDWVNNLIMDYETLSSFDIVFLNCGVGDKSFIGRDGLFPISVNQVAIANLRQFVQEGGSVYASDWAYNIVEKTWPDFVDFAGDDAEPEAAKVGDAPFDITANITDGQMALSLGQNTMELHYPLLQWAVMDSVSAQTTVYVRADADLLDGSTAREVPHTVAFRPGAGRVLFTSFHQEPGINPDMERVLQLLIFEL
jgi:hypothetical protein